jgi:hypothetical protein
MKSDRTVSFSEQTKAGGALPCLGLIIEWSNSKKVGKKPVPANNVYLLLEARDEGDTPLWQKHAYDLVVK